MTYKAGAIQRVMCNSPFSLYTHVLNRGGKGVYAVPWRACEGVIQNPHNTLSNVASGIAE